MNKKNKNFDHRLLKHIREYDTQDVELILKDLNPSEMKDKSDRTLLHIAAECGNEDVTQYLLKRGCQVNVTDKFGNTPLILAAESEEVSIMHALLQANANNVLVANKRGKSAAKIIIRDIRCHDISVLTELLKKVKEECGNGSVRTAKKLLELRCRLTQAVCLRDTVVIEYMLKSGCRVNDSSAEHEGLTPLHEAVACTDPDNVKLLLEYGANVEATTCNPPVTPVQLVRCHETGSTEVLKALLERGCRITDESGRLLVGKYFKYGNEEMVELLLQNVPDLDVKDHSGSPLLCYLAGNETFDPVEKLKGINVDVNAVSNENGSTALMAAVYSNNTRTVEWLLAKGARVNAVDKEGRKALVYAFNNIAFWAVDRRLETRLRCIELLLQHGGDAQWISRNQRTFFDDILQLKEFVLSKPLLANLAMAEAVGCEINQLVLASIASHSMFKGYFDFCKRTIEKMKNTKIRRSMTMFDFLTWSIKDIVELACSEKLVSRLRMMIDSKRRSKLYYYKILRKRLAIVDRVVNLRNAAIKVVLQIWGLCGNRVMAEKIVDYFTYDDLLTIELV